MPTKHGPPFLRRPYPGCPWGHGSTAGTCVAHTRLPMERALAPRTMSVKEGLNISIVCLKAFQGGGRWVLRTVHSPYPFSPPPMSSREQTAAALEDSSCLLWFDLLVYGINVIP